GQKLRTTYTNSYKCVGEQRARDKSKVVTWGAYNNNVAGANGNEVILTTSTWLGSTTAVTTLPYNTEPGNTKTIVVQVPIPTTTVTTSHLGVSTSLTTITNTVGGTATVVVDNPYHSTTTFTTVWTGTQTTTSTITNPTSAIDTVVVKIPENPTVTTTEPWTGSGVSTST
ncbi:Agglutinin-like protein 4, partial [Candida parapsilosis]